MLRYGEKLDLDKNLWDAIVTYMNDDIREDVHFDLAPCSEEEFLDEYVKRDPEFEKLLHEEFGIEMEEKDESIQAFKKIIRRKSVSTLYT